MCRIRIESRVSQCRGHDISCTYTSAKPQDRVKGNNKEEDVQRSWTSFRELYEGRPSLSYD